MSFGIIPISPDDKPDGFVLLSMYEKLESENAKLRELVKRYHHLVTGTDELWSWQSVYEQLRELGIEV